MAHIMSESKVFKSIDVAVVIPEDASELKMITQFISAMDSVRAVCSFDYMAQEDAIRELNSGNIQAVISLPESLYNDIYTGNPATATVYFPEKTALNIQVFQELLNAGLSLVSTAQAGVFASTDAAKIYQAQMDQYEIANYISYAYITCAFDRNEIFNNTVFSPFGNVDLYQYYLAAALSMILLMCGVNFGFLYQKQSRIVGQKLKIMGLNHCLMSMIKVLIMTTVLWIAGIICYSGIILIAEMTGIVKIWFEMKAVLWLLLLASAVAVYFHFVYSFFGNGLQGSVFMLSVNILMVLCSGAIVPAAYMPAAIAKIGAWMPLNFMNRFCASVMFDSVAYADALILVLWVVAVFILGLGVHRLWNISHGTRFCLKRG